LLTNAGELAMQAEAQRLTPEHRQGSGRAAADAEGSSAETDEGLCRPNSIVLHEAILQWTEALGETAERIRVGIGSGRGDWRISQPRCRLMWGG